MPQCFAIVASPGILTAPLGRVGRAVRVGFMLVIGLCGVSREARADTPPAVVAQSLFDEARTLMKDKRYTEACPKLEQSYALDSAGGTLINLALCHELEGRIATAWTEFNEAASIAHRDRRPERDAFARQHMASLAPLLPHVTFVVGAGAHVDLALWLDGTKIPPSAWGTALAVDPGSHRVVATVGDATWNHAFDAAGARATTVEIPPLASSRRAPPAVESPPGVPTRPAPERAEAPSPARGPAYALVAVGAVGIIGGGIFGVSALVAQADANRICPDVSCASDEALASNRNARSYALVADVALGVGVVALAAGVVWWLRTGGSRTSAPARTGVSW